jgi:hypothetical protein
MEKPRIHVTRKALIGLGIVLAVAGSQSVSAQEVQVGLGTASSFAVLAGSTVTNTGPSSISGDLGVSPGSAVVGFPPGTVTNGVIHAADAVALQAQLDLVTAFNVAAGLTPTAAIVADLGGQTLSPGVYSGGALGLTGTLTLDAQGNPNAVFVFQASSTLITGSGSNVSLINGANPCNVYWQVGSSATLGTTSTFVGTIMALASVTANTGATVQGRLLAQTGAVTLDNNVVNASSCAAAAPGTTTTTPGGTTAGPDGTTSTLPATGTALSAAMGAGVLLLLALGAAAMLVTRRGAEQAQRQVKT